MQICISENNIKHPSQFFLHVIQELGHGHGENSCKHNAKSFSFLVNFGIINSVRKIGQNNREKKINWTIIKMQILQDRERTSV